MSRKTEWISVEERLPELGSNAIVFDPHNPDQVYEDSTFVGTDGNIYWDFGGSDVTHWMPLPDPPTEG